MSPEEAGRPYTSLANIRRHLAERTQHNTKDGGPVTVPSMRISQSPVSSVAAEWVGGALCWNGMASWSFLTWQHAQTVESQSSALYHDLCPRH